MQIEFTAKVTGAETPAQLLAAAAKMLEKGFQMTQVQDETAVFTRTMPAEDFLESGADLRKSPAIVDTPNARSAGHKPGRAGGRAGGRASNPP